MSAYRQSPAIAGMQTTFATTHRAAGGRECRGFFLRGLRSAYGDELPYRARMHQFDRGASVDPPLPTKCANSVFYFIDNL
jgi:hypothetical protein